MTVENRDVYSFENGEIYSTLGGEKHPIGITTAQKYQGVWAKQIETGAPTWVVHAKRIASELDQAIADYTAFHTAERKRLEA